MIDDAKDLRSNDDVCPHILMVNKSERSAVFRALCHFSQSKINIDGRLPDSILTDLKVLVLYVLVRSDYLKAGLLTYGHILIPCELITFRVLVAPNKFLF